MQFSLVLWSRCNYYTVTSSRQCSWSISFYLIASHTTNTAEFSGYSFSIVVLKPALKMYDLRSNCLSLRIFWCCVWKQIRFVMLMKTKPLIVAATFHTNPYRFCVCCKPGFPVVLLHSSVQKNYTIFCWHCGHLLKPK